MASATRFSQPLSQDISYLEYFLPVGRLGGFSNPPLPLIDKFLTEPDHGLNFSNFLRAALDRTFFPLSTKDRMVLYSAFLEPADEVLKMGIRAAAAHHRPLDLLAVEAHMPALSQNLEFETGRILNWVATPFFEALTASKHFPVAVPRLNIERCSPVIQKIILKAAVKLGVDKKLERFLALNFSCHGHLNDIEILSEIRSDQLYPLLCMVNNRRELLDLLLHMSPSPRLGWILRAAAVEGDTATVEAIVTHPRYSDIPPLYSSEAERHAPTAPLRNLIAAARSRRRGESQFCSIL